MRFWDSSAIVPILLTEATTERARASWAEDRSMAVWWGTSIECVAAFARAEREGRLEPDGLATASRDLEAIQQDFAFGAEFLFHHGATGNNDIVAFAVKLDDLELKVLAFEVGGITHRADVNQ